jgi:hypothetical protein
MGCAFFGTPFLFIFHQPYEIKYEKVFINIIASMLASSLCQAQGLQLNDLEYFERQGVNVLVFSNSFNGGFNDEKDSGIEIIHHGVRTAQGGAIRLNNAPEQWDLVPTLIDRKVDKANNTIEISMCYEDYDFDSKVQVTGKGDAVEISVYLDKPVPEAIAGEAGFNLEFLPSQYWLKTFMMDGRLNRFPRYAASETITRPNSQKARQFKGFKTYDDWPFLWGQNEGTVGGNTQYVIFGEAFKNVLKK